MTTLAATGDTWGIPGPTFLAYFFSAVIVVAVAAAIHRRILFYGRSADASRLGPQQVAYLNGKGKLAVYTSIGGLRAAGAIGSGPDKTLVQTGHMPSGVTPLDVAVHNAAGRQIRARDVESDQWVAQAIDQLRDGLQEAGLVVTRGQQRVARLWALAGAVLVLIGIARFVDGIQNDRPVLFLFPMLFLAVILALVSLTKARRAQTFAAVKAMRALRKQHSYLAPALSPSYATYGAAGAAMGVALYGGASLYAMDPAFAADAEIQRISAGSGAGSSSGGGGDSGSGSSCSGGSSSCGGGGGCGGGGCGG